MAFGLRPGPGRGDVPAYFTALKGVHDRLNCGRGWLHAFALVVGDGLKSVVC